jgi:hypothetical protein
VHFLSQGHILTTIGAANTFLTFKFSYLFFLNPNDKTKIGIANKWELLLANYMDSRPNENREQK